MEQSCCSSLEQLNMVRIHTHTIQTFTKPQENIKTCHKTHTQTCRHTHTFPSLKHRRTQRHTMWCPKFQGDIHSQINTQCTQNRLMHTHRNSHRHR